MAIGYICPGLCLLMVVFGFMPNSAVATSIRFASFGAPVVAENKLIFADHFEEARRLICIDRGTGKRLWETSDQERAVEPCFLSENGLVVMSGSDLKKCDVETGKLMPLYQTGLEGCSYGGVHKGQVFVAGHRRNVDYIAAVDSGDWGKRWEAPRIHHVLGQGSEVVLCSEGTREAAKGGSRIPKDAYRYVNNAIVGISRESGKVLWRRLLSDDDWTPPGIALSNCFIVEIKGRVLCLRQTDGYVLKQLEVAGGDHVPVAFARRGDKVLMWLNYSVSEMTVPGLEKRDLFHAGGYSGSEVQVYENVVVATSLYENHAWHIPSGNRLWKVGQWNAARGQDGFIYFGRPDDGGKTTSMNKIEITTGKIERLYQEELKN
jgi:outer membrane protein assembly factor BamB